MFNAYYLLTELFVLLSTKTEVLTYGPMSLYCTIRKAINISREFSENCWITFFRNLNQKHFSLFSDKFRLFRTFFQAFLKIFRIFWYKCHRILFLVYLCFLWSVFQNIWISKATCINLVDGLRIGIYEDQKIHMKTDSCPISSYCS